MTDTINIDARRSGKSVAQALRLASDIHRLGDGDGMNVVINGRRFYIKAAHSPKGADTQRAEASHPKPSEQTSEPSDPNLRSHTNLSRLIEAAERLHDAVERASIAHEVQDEYDALDQALQPYRSGK
ncbi:MAG: hypothetical protein VX529_08170 [Pseudomonadota bacterium]|nr:hypothetical protein [Pseudomonadota bacterium]